MGVPGHIHETVYMPLLILSQSMITFMFYQICLNVLRICVDVFSIFILWSSFSFTFISALDIEEDW